MRTLWIASLVLAADLNAADVTVYVAADVAASVYPAECIAGKMFREAGVTVAWRMGLPPHRVRSSGLVLAVELATLTEPERLPGALAVAYPYAGMSRGITVFYDRIQRRAPRDPTLEHALLAHVLVHEITHVLQGIDRHSDTGIMKSHWDSDDYAAMAVRPLPFAEEDLLLIRRGRLLQNDQKSLAVR